MLTVHHLDNSRSQRVLWLLEELGVPYEIAFYKRDPETMLAPRELRAVHPAANQTTVEFTLDATPVPLHPGAIRYFEEIGATIPDRLRP